MKTFIIPAECPNCEAPLEIEYTTIRAGTNEGYTISDWGKWLMEDANIWMRSCNCIISDNWVMEQAETAFYAHPEPDYERGF